MADFGEAPFVLDEERTAAEGRPRTTRESIQVAVDAILANELWVDADETGMLNRGDLVVPMGGRMHVGSFVDLASQCAPKDLGTNWPEGMVGYMGLMAEMVKKMDAHSAQKRDAAK